MTEPLRFERAVLDRHAETRVVGVEIHEHGWNGLLDGKPVPLGALRDVLALIEATRGR